MRYSHSKKFYCNDSRPLIHYAQLHKKDNFVKYDFGSEEENSHHYGSPIPPNYDLSKVSAPLALFFGENDDLATMTGTRPIKNIIAVTQLM